jgi:hypothetical protein
LDGFVLDQQDADFGPTTVGTWLGGIGNRHPDANRPHEKLRLAEQVLLLQELSQQRKILRRNYF